VRRGRWFRALSGAHPAAGTGGRSIDDVLRPIPGPWSFVRATLVEDPAPAPGSAPRPDGDHTTAPDCRRRTTTGYYRCPTTQLGRHWPCLAKHASKQGKLEGLPGKATALLEARMNYPEIRPATCPTSARTSSTTPASGTRAKPARPKLNHHRTPDPPHETGRHTTPTPPWHAAFGPSCSTNTIDGPRSTPY